MTQTPPPEENTFVNPLLQAATTHWNSLPRGVLSAAELEDIILHQMILREEAERQWHIVTANRAGFHFMQGPALSEIIGWTNRAIEFLQRPNLIFEHRGTHDLLMQNGECDPAIVFDWMFSSLGKWLNCEDLTPETTA